MNKTLLAYGLLLIVVVASLFVIKTNVSITGKAVDVAEKPAGQPNFEVTLTAYYTTSVASGTIWKTGVPPVADQRRYCGIPESQRGVYEEARCQGSIVYDGRVYSYADVKDTLQQSTPLPMEFTNGRTAQGTNPMPHRTIAVNYDEGSQCYIPPNSNVYIYIEPNNPWNGWYIAEDTGDAMKKQCKIDIYAGVGKEALSQAVPFVSLKKAQIYVFDKGYARMNDQSTKYTTFGTYTIKPGFSVTKNHNAEIYETLKTFSQDVMNQCTVNTADCLNKQITAFNSQHQDVSLTENCEDETTKVFQRIVENIQDCSYADHANVCMCDLTKDIVTDQTTIYDLSFQQTGNANNQYQYTVSMKNNPETLPLLTNHPLDFTDLSFSVAPGSSDNKRVLVSATPQLDGGNLYLAFNPAANDPKYSLVKIENGNVFDKQGLIDPAIPTDACPFTKEHYKICAVSKETYPISTNGKIVFEPLKIKFSLFLEDKTPPVAGLPAPVTP
jgi:3D (Asp-Asp-Asp) domain-containing protein